MICCCFCAQISFHSRTLTQRADSAQNNGMFTQICLWTCCFSDDFTCALSPLQLRQWFDESTQQWTVTDRVLQELNHNIQAIVNCTSENDVVAFQSRRRIVPASSVTIPWKLTLKGDSSTRFNCPRSGAFLISK